MAKAPAKSASRRGEAPRSRRARAIGDMLPAIGGASFRRFGFVQSSVVSRWREIVGERYAEVSAPESIRFPPGRRSAGVLRLTVAGAHATMLQHVEPAIIERVNRFFGYPAVARISIRQAAVARRQEPRAPVPAARPIPRALGESLREIADPELRACLEGLAGAVAASRADASKDRASAQPLEIMRLDDIGRAPDDGAN